MGNSMILEDFDDVFADIANVLIFQGEQKIMPDDLVSISDDALSGIRFITKHWKSGNANIALYRLGMDLEAEQDALLQVLNHERIHYQKQITESLETITPIISIGLYYGTAKKWDQACSIKEMFAIPTELENNVSNFKINVFNIAWLDDALCDRFQSDFGIITKYLAGKREGTPIDVEKIPIWEHPREAKELLSSL